MKAINRLAILLISSILIIKPIILFAQSAPILGHINFETSGKSEAKPYFETGVMLLHSFEYDKARKQFLLAEKHDPDFAMAYWGEAMTYHHTLWQEENHQQGVNALARLGATEQERLAKAKLPKENGYIRAINFLYGNGNQAERIKHYSDEMRNLYRAYPDDDEIALFYSLSLLDSSDDEASKQKYMQAAAIAGDVAERNKANPGALHYLIHALDDPIHAPLGLHAARIYAKVAPDSPHALHMPSHIFLALGMWDDVIQSNQAAWDAGKRENPEHDLKRYTNHDMHALYWLSYAHLQKKHYQAALYLTQLMHKIALSMKSPIARWHYAQMRADYLSAARGSEQLPAIDISDVELSAQANQAYIEMLAKSKTASVPELTQLADSLERKVSHASPHIDQNDYFTGATKTSLVAANIVVMEMRAHIAYRQGQAAKALQYLTDAVKLEEQVASGYGPPIPVKPSSELMADMLQESGQYQKAYRQYLVTLSRYPNRLAALKGLEQARKALVKSGIRVPEGIKPYFHRLMQPKFFH